ncbi:MAG: mechanosensitive ion channel family protein, partial [Pseudomonadota bacterium]|nr:mechanosensitive ion channel family protein [Pseudomonadota bacterium]
IWDELRVTIHYGADHAQAEAIMLDAGRRHSVDPATVQAHAADKLLRRFNLEHLDFVPKVYYRLTENWLELTLRFVFHDHGTRAAKDAISRDVLAGFGAAGIAVAAPARELIPRPPIALRPPPEP